MKCLLPLLCLFFSLSAQAALSPLHIRNSQWVDVNNTPVALIGTNLGNWLSLEFWMLAMADDIADQCALEKILDRRFGHKETEKLLAAYRQSWLTEADWDILASFGFNLVRLPFHWSIIESEDKPQTLRADAWMYLDWAVAQAKQRGMYVLLDLHGAPGGQGWEHHTGCGGQNALWASEENRARTRWIWQQIAVHFRHEPAVAGYGLLNEPWGASPEVMATFAEELYREVRKLDKEHVIVLPGHLQGIAAYGNPADRGLTNVALEMHFYPGHFGWQSPGYAVHRDWLTCGANGKGGVCNWQNQLRGINAGFLVGEFQPWEDIPTELAAPITRATYDRYSDLHWAATSWAYKVVARADDIHSWGLVTTTPNLAKVDFSTASLDQIHQYFAQFADAPRQINTALHDALTAPEPAKIFSLPSAPRAVTINTHNDGVELRWKKSGVPRYRIYRSAYPDVGYELLADTERATYVDPSPSDRDNFYRVTSVKDLDESFPGESVSLARKRQVIPGQIEAEAYLSITGMEAQRSDDIPSTGDAHAFNLGWIDKGDTATYAVTVRETGCYKVTARLASESGSEPGIEIKIGDAATVLSVPDTGGWQFWSSASRYLPLVTGDQRLTIVAASGGWNINWLDFQFQPDPVFCKK
ncbi:cellulase family glycosylhydrolase [Teredinibacter turnerae]|uniref:cellulase family glycosylhydrolase n=1 Tax=Teredinibacter turnerae TaxID=2426 RepID=UPI000376A1D6|nr:cellulase family glycosylhydrolase [Teredinibacter turnerae]